MRRWTENRLAMLVATYYAAAMARAITVLPHDELPKQVGSAQVLGQGPGCARQGTRNANSQNPRYVQHRQNSDKEQQVTHTSDDQMSHGLIAETASALGADLRNGSALAGAKDTASGLERVPTPSAVLVVKRGPNAGSRFRLDQPVTSAGRHPDSNIVLDDITVSRRHAEFRRETGEFRVADVGSLNGTYLNGEPIDSAVLTNGDEIGMGKFRLVFLTGGDGLTPRG